MDILPSKFMIYVKVNLFLKIQIQGTLELRYANYIFYYVQ